MLFAGIFPASSVALARNGGVPVDYIGHRSHPLFTRLVFGTGTAAPERFRIGYDEVGRKVVFASMDSTLAFSFEPVDKVDSTVSAIDYIQVEPGKLGVIIRLGKNAVGFRVSYLYNPNRIVLDIYKQTVEKPFMPAGREISTIAIDPGHGGTSLGAVGSGALNEADTVFKLSQKLKAALEDAGFSVVMTRDAQTAPEAHEREGLANSERADMYVSIHAAQGAGRAGATVITPDEGRLGQSSGGDLPMMWRDQNAVYLPESTRLAAKVAGHLKALAGVEPPVRHAPLFGFYGLSMPAVMVEFGGLGGAGTGAPLAESSYLDRLASLLANGIKAYAKGR